MGACATPAAGNLTMYNSRRRQPIKPEAAYTRLADMCARGEQCASDLREKMWRWGVRGSDADRIIEKLELEGFLDEERYARAYARDKVRFSGWGRRKVAAMLAAKRIGSSAIREALEAVDPEFYREALEKAAAAKCRSLDLDQAADRVKAMRFLLQRGFDADQAAAELNRLRRGNR